MPSKRRTVKRNTDATFLDANIFMYAAGGPHPLRESCQKALEAGLRRRTVLVTNSEVLQEILYRYFSIQKPETAVTVHRSIIDLCDEVLPVTKAHTSRALGLLLQYEQISPRDAIHVATMEDRGIREIVSMDKDFDEVKEVRRIDPAAF